MIIASDDIRIHTEDGRVVLVELVKPSPPPASVATEGPQDNEQEMTKE